MRHEITIRDVPDQEVAAIRTRADLRTIGRTVGEALGELYAFLGRRGIMPAGPPMAVYHEVDPVEGVDVQVCVPVPRRIRGEGRIVRASLPGGPAVRTLHRGSYEELEQAYTEVQDWASAKGRVLTPWMMERYLNGPGEGGMDELETEILWPLQLELAGAPA